MILANEKKNLQIEAGQLPTVTHLSVLDCSAVQWVQIRQRGREAVEAVDANGDNDGSDELLMPWVAYVTLFPIRPGFLICCRLSLNSSTLCVCACMCACTLVRVFVCKSLAHPEQSQEQSIVCVQRTISHDCSTLCVCMFLHVRAYCLRSDM